MKDFWDGPIGKEEKIWLIVIYSILFLLFVTLILHVTLYNMDSKSSTVSKEKTEKSVIVKDKPMPPPAAPKIMMIPSGDILIPVIIP